MKKVLYILGAMKDEDAEWIARNGQRRALGRGEVLIQQGRSPGAVYIILDGEFSVRAGTTQVARIGRGEILGEVSFVDRRPATATVEALEASSVLMIPLTQLQARIDADPAFAARFYLAISTFLADRLRTTLLQLQGNGAVGEGADELDLDSLDSVSRAGARFDRILQRLGGG